MDWISRYFHAAGETDTLRDDKDHVQLLAAGLLGEVGSILAEVKKERREKRAYPKYRRALDEEFGDFLWYFFRLLEALDASLLEGLPTVGAADPTEAHSYLRFGVAAGSVVDAVAASSPSAGRQLIELWSHALLAAADLDVDLESAAEKNLQKTKSRWPTARRYADLFDDEYDVFEQLPRSLQVEFVPRERGGQQIVTLRCNGLNFGDTLSDNIRHPDEYRYHDAFHFAYMAILGWSPIIRSLMRCKRKSNAAVDEAEDGARAGIIEEAISALVFSRAKMMDYFADAQHVDYDLLKAVHELVVGYEVEAIPLWQWEEAILKGFQLFRQLRDNAGGRVTIDMASKRLEYSPPSGGAHSQA